MFLVLLDLLVRQSQVQHSGDMMGVDGNGSLMLCLSSWQSLIFVTHSTIVT